ncbi:unnamed protein product [Protopolystoma xenopodis]|uniref:Uncharacterized protein n=1 Tax=Protopolystoma xenopodis TaxID=117903 RepID=A0A448WFF8_9PLAT|nr:unnamed protein product [Protopolystoma xenopodis]
MARSKIQEQVDCSILTPKPILQASGDVYRFTDFMVKDISSGKCFCADYLITAGALNLFCMRS